MTVEKSLTQSDIDLMGLMTILRRRVRWLSIALLVGAVGAWVVSLAVPPTYTATTRLLPPSQNSLVSLPSQFGAIANISGLGGLNIKSPADTYVALLKSRTILDRILDRFDLHRSYGDRYREDSRHRLAKRTAISVSKEGVITVDVDDRDPARAADIANAYVNELLRLNNRLAITEAQKRRMFFESQLKSSHERMRVAEVDLARAGFSADVLKMAPQAILEAVARLKAQITAQEIRIATMRSAYNENHPDLRLARQELLSMRMQLTAMEGTQPATAKLSDSYLEKYREYKYQEALLEVIGKQYELAKIDEAKEGGHIQVIDPAVIPERKSGPKSLAWALVGMLVALTFTVVLVVLRDTPHLRAL